jgi:hypothetical protein
VIEWKRVCVSAISRSGSAKESWRVCFREARLQKVRSRPAKESYRVMFLGNKFTKDKEV